MYEEDDWPYCSSKDPRNTLHGCMENHKASIWIHKYLLNSLAHTLEPSCMFFDSKKKKKAWQKKLFDPDVKYK